MKICFIVGALESKRGGVTDYSIRLISSLAHKEELDIYVVTLIDENDFSTWVGIPNITVHSIVEAWNFAGFSSVVEFVEAGDFDLVHYQHPTVAYGKNLSQFTFLRKISKPVVVTLHEYSQSPWYAKPWIKLLRSLADTAIVTNQADADLLGDSSIIPIGSNIPVINNADIESFKSEQFGDSFVISFFGSIERGKGVEQLLDWFADLAFEKDRFKLCFIGSFDPDENAYHAVVQARVAQLNLRDQIVFTNYLTPAEVSKYIHVSDVGIGLFEDGFSWRRGSALAFIDHGKPYISSYPAFNDSQSEAVLFADTKENFISTIEQLQSKKYYQEQVVRVSELSKEFSWEAIASRHLEVYTQIV